jgi:hypothetical protein
MEMKYLKWGLVWSLLEKIFVNCIIKHFFFLLGKNCEISNLHCFYYTKNNKYLTFSLIYYAENIHSLLSADCGLNLLQNLLYVEKNKVTSSVGLCADIKSL